MLLLELSSSLTTTQESGRKQYCKGACSTGEVVSPRTFNYAKRTRVFPHTIQFKVQLFIPNA